MDFEDSKTKILEILKEGEKSSTEISSIIKRDYYKTLEILGELEQEGSVEKLNLGDKYTFWKLKNG